MAPKFKPHVYPPPKHQKVVRGTRCGSQNGPELTSESPKIHKMLQKSCFLTWPFFEQISRREETRFGQFLVSKWEGGRHEPGPLGREPEGGFHPPWRVITTSRSETEWNVVTFWPADTPSPGLKPRGGFKKLRLQPPRELAVCVAWGWLRLLLVGAAFYW